MKINIIYNPDIVEPFSNKLQVEMKTWKRLWQRFNFGAKIFNPKLRHQEAICWLGKELPWLI
jgi:hypothetical protein